MPPATSTGLKAGEVMDRVAALMNDPNKTDYTYVAQLPYLNMAIDELQESLEESNASPTNLTSAAITVAVGKNKMTAIDDLVYAGEGPPHYPYDLVEIQEVAERATGSSDAYIPLGRREFLSPFPITSSLLYWVWEDQAIKFNPVGASSSRDIQLKYVRMPLQLAANENSVIATINARSYLSFKAGAFCANFIGEDESRAAQLDAAAQTSLDRILGINAKGRQELVTRRKPFRANYKSRGWA
jgi:hypothetical protein